MTRAETALFTFFGIDRITHKVFTHMRGAFFVADMSDVLVLKMRKGRKYGVRRSLTETAERIAFDVRGEFLQRVEVVHRAFAAGTIRRR